MRRLISQYLLLVVAGLALIAGNQVFAVHADTLPPSQGQIRRWVDELNHDDFSVREKAAAGLSQAGPRALHHLTEAVISRNPEVAWRASEVLERMAVEGDEETLNRIVVVLNELARGGKPGLAQIASQMRQRQQAFRHDRAVAALRAMGGKIGGPNGGMEEAIMLGGGFGGGIMVVPAIARVDVIEAAEDPAEAELESQAALNQFLLRWEQFPLADLRAAASWFSGSAKKVEGPESILKGEVPVEELVKGAEAPLSPTERLAATLVPGTVGDAVRSALGKVQLKTANTISRLAGRRPMDAVPVRPTDFRLPRLEGEEQAALPIETLFPGEEMALAGDPGPVEEVAADDAGDDAIVHAAPLFVAGMEPASEEDMPLGVMWLNREWRGGDEGLKHLADLHNMATLQIEAADVGDAALKHIAKMPALRHLQIRGSNFSRAGLRAFHRQRPKVSIMAMGEGMMGVNGNYTSDTCLLEMVAPGSGAADAGLAAGDEVLSIGDDEIRDFSDLTIAVATRKPGDKFKVVYRREGTRHETQVTLKSRAGAQ